LNQEIEVKLNPASYNVEFFIYWREGEELHLVDTLDFAYKKVNEGRSLRPSFSLGIPVVKEMLERLLKMFKSQGVLFEIGSESEEMKAVKYHLEDMRQLVFEEGKR